MPRRAYTEQGQFLRTYVCPARVDPLETWHVSEVTSPIELAIGLRAGTVVCKFCGLVIHPDATVRATYTELFVIQEHP